MELQAINATLSGACDTWRCQFVEGKKKPRFMACGPQPLPLLEGACGALCGQIPAQVDQIKVLGILLDSQLSFLPLFSQAVAELQNIGGKLASGLSSHGFGLPAVASQFMTRVLPAALHGCELLITVVISNGPSFQSSWTIAWLAKWGQFQGPYLGKPSPI